MLPSLWCVCAVSECVGGCIQGGSSTCCVSRLAWWRMGDWLTHQIRHLLSGLPLAGDYLCIMQYHNDTRRQTRRDGKRLTALTTRRAALLVGCRSEVPTAAPRRQAHKIDLHLHDTQDAVFCGERKSCPSNKKGKRRLRNAERCRRPCRSSGAQSVLHL